MKVIIFTDGSSRGNPGPGGWGSIIVSEKNIKEIGGREDNTTNNRMELLACIEALKNINKDDEIVLNSDSEYVVKGMTLWIKGWIKNNWKTASKKPVLNQDLWQDLLNVSNGLKISWQTVAGHAGIEGNERCDVIATSFADNEKIELYNGSPIDYSIKFF